MEKPQILLLTHGGWGMKLVEGIRMILGEIDCVSEIPLEPEVTFVEYYKIVEEQVKGLPEGSIIITDVFGGTTTNVAAKLGKDHNIKVLSGLNAPILIEACSQIMFNGECKFDEVLAAGQDSVMDVVDKVLESMQKKEK